MTSAPPRDAAAEPGDDAASDAFPNAQPSAKQLHIIEAATPLFMKYGFHETSVRMIADAAGLSMGSLYQYIRTKEDLLYLAAMHSLSEMAPVIMRSVDPVRPIREQIATLLSDYITVLDRNRKVFKMVYRETASLGDDLRPRLMAAESRLTEMFVEHVEVGMASGEIEPVCNPKVAGLNLCMFAHTVGDQGLVAEEPRRPAALPR